jgi:predicted DNA-binding transcriptional regulator AlpA
MNAPDENPSSLECPVPFLLKAKDVAVLLNVSPGTLARMKASSQIPPHVVLANGSHRWRRADILAWVESGCPPIKEFLARRRAR